jgi:hypothetical protein
MVAVALLDCNQNASTAPSGSNPSTTPSTGPVTFTDQNFSNADWSEVVRVTQSVSSTGGSGSASQQSSGGVGGSAYRQVLARKEPTTGERGSTWVYSFKSQATYNPSSQRAITSIDFSISGKQFVSANVSGGSVALALRQGGVLYFAPHPQSPGGQLPVEQRDWEPEMRTGLLQTDFRDHDLMGRQLDFAVTGGNIELGFVFWVSTIPVEDGGGPSDRTAGFDNWSVTIHRQ